MWMSFRVADGRPRPLPPGGSGPEGNGDDGTGGGVTAAPKESSGGAKSRVSEQGIAIPPRQAKRVD